MGWSTLLWCALSLAVVGYTVTELVKVPEWSSKGIYMSENALMPDHAANRVEERHVQRFRRESERFAALAAGHSSASAVLELWAQETSRLAADEPAVHLQPYGLDGYNAYSIVRAPRADGADAMLLAFPVALPADSRSNGVGMGAALRLLHSDAAYLAKDVILLWYDASRAETAIRAFLHRYTHAPELEWNPWTPNAPLPASVPSGGPLRGCLFVHPLPGNATLRDVELRLQGASARLPNLDLVTVTRNALRGRGFVLRLETGPSWAHTLVQFVRGRVMGWGDSVRAFTLADQFVLQAWGVPSDAHGIASLFDLEALSVVPHGSQVPLDSVASGIADDQAKRYLAAVESVARSLNCLIEPLHQSFFQYYLPDMESYISIALYSPALVCVLVLPVLRFLSLLASGSSELLNCLPALLSALGGGAALYATFPWMVRLALPPASLAALLVTFGAAASCGTRWSLSPAADTLSSSSDGKRAALAALALALLLVFAIGQFVANFALTWVSAAVLGPPLVGLAGMDSGWGAKSTSALFSLAGLATAVSCGPALVASFGAYGAPGFLLLCFVITPAALLLDARAWL